MDSPPPISAILRETESLQAVNATLQYTLATLDEIQGHLNTLSDNFSNSIRLCQTYADIHSHNRQLQTQLGKAADGSSITSAGLDSHIEQLKSQIDSLNGQLRGVE